MTTPQHDLQTVINLWADLENALETPTSMTWPPAGLAAYMNALDQLDAEEVAEIREARGWQRAGTVALGERPVPIVVKVHDTIRAVNLALVDLADNVADHVQRPPASRLRAAGPGDDIALRIATATIAAVEADQRDPRRWSITNPRYRTAPYAAAWLLARLDDAPGPFRQLSPLLRERITHRASDAAQRVQAALEMKRRQRRVQHPCPHCRGHLDVHGGDGQPPQVRCTNPDCGWTRTGVSDVA